MHKKLKRALCCVAAVAAAAGIATAAACTGDTYNSTALDGDYSYEEDELISNGGFAVQAGDYVYFINGVEENTADNTYGDVQKGALVRISLENLAAGNYSSVQTVVPLVMYSSDYDAGIYIYGDYVYYSTPATTRNSDGEVLNDRLDFKRTKLDGTETNTQPLFQSGNTSLEYRFVQVDGTVYLVYVASEQLYTSTASTNIHSVNLTTGEDTLLAYGISSYTFDTEDLTNPYIYYTMGVTYYLGMGSSVEQTAPYNQVYRVRADATESPREYDFSYVEDYDAEEDPLYVNLGDYVFDGLGTLSGMTQFNYGYDAGSENPAGGNVDANSLSGYSYTIVGYEGGTFYYTRTYHSGGSSDSSSSNSTPILFYTDDGQVGAADWNPVSGNPVATDNYGGRALLLSAGSISGYTYLKDDSGTPAGILYTESITNGYALMYAAFDGNGALVTQTDRIIMSTESDAITLLNTSEETVDGVDYTFLYYSVSGEGNSYSVHRIALGGDKSDYQKWPTSSISEEKSNYRAVRILDLDVATGWYNPEVLAGHFFFPSDTTDMVDYAYIMAFDLRDKDAADGGAVNVTMSNQDIEAINDLYDSVIDEENGVIADISEDDYENLPNALRYAFYSRDRDYLAELIQMWVDAGEDEEYLYSAQSAQRYLDFCDAAGMFEEFAAYSREVNGETVYATSRDYYYCLVGYMSDDDAENYIDDLRSTYMQAEPEEEVGWFEGLSTGAKAGFIIGVVVGGLIVIAAAVLIPLLVRARRRRRLPEYSKKRIKVDTTDDRNIDVYSDESAESGDGDSGADGEDKTE